MSYTSLLFVIFALVVTVVYFAFPIKKYQWTVLLVASYVFYLCASVKSFFFIFFTTITTYVVTRMLEKIQLDAKVVLKDNKETWNRESKKAFKIKVESKKRKLVSIVLLANFGILAFLKYYNFFGESINNVLKTIGLSAELPGLKLILPLGISFYTFQSMGYIVDVYRGTVSAEKNFAKLALFVSFFPQIIQGPIGIYNHLANQLYESHKFDFTRMKYGMELILWGYFKKMVIADRAVTAINAYIADYQVFNGGTTLFIVILYALQLYADFSAGIDISRGLAQIWGIDMAHNFRRPYFARSINEYWRRWHITLGDWMKNYVFYPLAMSKMFLNISKKMKNTKFGQTATGAHIAKVLPASIASFVVFFLVGVWHGANWKYVGFGIWNGGIIMLSTLMKPCFEYINQKLRISADAMWFRLFQMFRTFIVVAIGYVFDIAPHFKGSIQMLYSSIANINIGTTWNQIRDMLLLSKMDYLVVFLGALVILIVSLLQERQSQVSLRIRLDKTCFPLRWVLVFGCVVCIMIFGIYGPGYDVAEFVYMQF